MLFPEFNDLSVDRHEKRTEVDEKAMIRPLGYEQNQAQLGMNFFLLIVVKMPTIVGILTLMIMKYSILGSSAPENC